MRSLLFHGVEMDCSVCTVRNPGVFKPVFGKPWIRPGRESNGEPPFRGIGFLDRDAVEAMTVLELFRRQTTLAREIVKDEIHPGDRVIDGTAGNGSDTLFLAQCVETGGTYTPLISKGRPSRPPGKKLTEAG